MKIPCGNKCLKYPVCKTKRALSCEALTKYYRSEEKNKYHDPWRIIKELFPNLEQLHVKF